MRTCPLSQKETNVVQIGCLLIEPLQQFDYENDEVNRNSTCCHCLCIAKRWLHAAAGNRQSDRTPHRLPAQHPPDGSHHSDGQGLVAAGPCPLRCPECQRQGLSNRRS
ncbi:MAG: hypothetical protein ABR887_08345 [Methanoregulaceae archaeon]